MTEVLQARRELGQWIGEPFTAPMLVTAEFGEPRNNGVGYHTGLDLAPLTGQPGTPIRLTSSGAFIMWCGVYQGTRARDQNGGYGNVLLLRLTNQYQLLIAHMMAFSDPIQQWIDAGFPASLKPTFSPNEVIGYQGNTGYVYGSLPDGTFGIPADDDNISATHTHLEVRNPAGQLVNPASVLTGYDFTGRESNAPLIF